MTLSKAFLDYFQNEFFLEDAVGFSEFQQSLLRPLKKTLRINPARRSIPEFIQQKTAEGWTFTPTENPLSFRIDRENTEVALGSTLEHLLGDFYIQELSASMSVWHLSEWGIGPYRQWKEPFRILDMASSPWGKTTQLAEHFPNSFIVANEFGKERISPLIENTERMGTSDRTGITNMNGVLFGNLTETFDRILLDAPCSGEGIGFKAEEALKYWHLKNVKTIERLQEKLLIAGVRALKTGGELLYSTCTLNRFENEGVINAAMSALPGVFEVLFQKRFWPHKEGAGGFFIAKIRKIAQKEENGREFRSQPNVDIVECGDREITKILSTLNLLGTSDFSPETHRFFRYKNDVLSVRNIPEISSLISTCYFLRLGERIGRLENGEFQPNWILGKNNDLSGVPKLILSDDTELHRYLSGFEMPVLTISNGTGPEMEHQNFIQIVFKNRLLGIEKVRNSKATNSFPKEWRRK